MIEPPNPLTPTELAALDAQYKPFPRFEAWPKLAPRPGLWERKVAELENHVLASTRALCVRGIGSRSPTIIWSE